MFWIPHELSEVNLIEHISISDLLRKNEKSDSLLKRMVTGDKKLIVYIKRKNREDNTVKRQKALRKQSFT